MKKKITLRTVENQGDDLSKQKKKKIEILSALPGETLSDFYKRVDEYKCKYLDDIENLKRQIE